MSDKGRYNYYDGIAYIRLIKHDYSFVVLFIKGSESFSYQQNILNIYFHLNYFDKSLVQSNLPLK